MYYQVKKTAFFDTLFLLLIKILKPRNLLIYILVISTNEVLKILLNIRKKL